MEKLLSYDIASFQACINMLKINTRPDVYNMLTAILCDFEPKEEDSRRRTIRYVNILLRGEHGDLADCLLSFLPDPIPLTSQSSSNRSEETTPKQHVKAKTKVKKRAGQLLDQAAACHILKAASPKSYRTSRSKVNFTGRTNKHGGPIGKKPCRLSQKSCVDNNPLLKTPKKKPINCSVISDILQRSDKRPVGHMMQSPVTMTKGNIFTTNINTNLNLPPVPSEKHLYQDNVSTIGTTDPIRSPKLPEMTYTYMTPSLPFIIGQGVQFPSAGHVYGFPGQYASPSIPARYQKGIAVNPTPFYAPIQPSTPRYVYAPHEHSSRIAEEYLATHVTEKTVTGPELVSPFLRRKPTCIVELGDTPVSTSSNTSSQKMIAKSSNVKTKLVHTIGSSVHESCPQGDQREGYFPGVMRVNTNLPIRIQHPLPKIEVDRNALPIDLSLSKESSQTSTVSRNLSVFPYIQQMTLPDGQTQHLRIQGSGDMVNNRVISTSTVNGSTVDIHEDQNMMTNQISRAKPRKRKGGAPTRLTKSSMLSTTVHSRDSSA